MNILLLGEQADNTLAHYFFERGDKVCRRWTPKVDWIISFGHRKIIPMSLIKQMQGRILNIHISYLPWNRGANPNQWSFINDTPKGVTIHQIDAGIDTGPIYVQKKMEFHSSITMSESYVQLVNAGAELLKDNWASIISGKLKPRKQVGRGSYQSIAKGASLPTNYELSAKAYVAEYLESLYDFNLVG